VDFLANINWQPPVGIAIQKNRSGLDQEILNFNKAVSIYFL